MYTYLWEYSVAPDDVEAFLRHYGPEGSWVRLFREADGYVGTSLLRDRDDPSRFVTIDRWTSKQAHAAFLAEHGGTYASLDAECEDLTRAEALIGHFGAAT